jgi:small-conductance mechanosensitive channel
MLAIREILLHRPMEIVAPTLVFLIALAVGYLLRRAFLHTLRAWSTRSRSRPARILDEALRGPTVIWLLILAGHLAIQSSDLPAQVNRWETRIALVLWILSLTLMCARIAGDMVRYYGSEVPGALPVTTLTQNLAQMSVAILGLLVLLNQLGVSITPILTALGVGGLAVALALQPTLSNLFAGFYVAVAGQIRLGDYIKLNTGEEGYVTDITWRSTTLRALTNNYIIVPNSKLAEAIVTNYHLPGKPMNSKIEVGVSYDCDPDRVERVLLDIAKQAAGEIPGMLREPPPTVTFDPGFGDSALSYSINYQVAEFSNQFGVREELKRRVLRRFRQEGIEIPFPTRTIRVHSSEQAANPHS